MLCCPFGFKIERLGWVGRLGYLFYFYFSGCFFVSGWSFGIFILFLFFRLFFLHLEQNVSMHLAIHIQCRQCNEKVGYEFNPVISTKTEWFCDKNVKFYFIIFVPYNSVSPIVWYINANKYDDLASSHGTVCKVPGGLPTRREDCQL